MNLPVLSAGVVVLARRKIEVIVILIPPTKFPTGALGTVSRSGFFFTCAYSGSFTNGGAGKYSSSSSSS